VHKEAGRPWPIVCPEDDVIDYMVMEAVAIRVKEADEKAAKQAKIKDWQGKTSSLDHLR
jgi:hypothetical protein